MLGLPSTLRQTETSPVLCRAHSHWRLQAEALTALIHSKVPRSVRGDQVPSPNTSSPGDELERENTQLSLTKSNKPRNPSMPPYY